MSTAPSVSAITIFLNEENYIEEAVKSILGQTYDNWELLLVDDGSTDKSTAIAKRYAALYPNKIRYLEHPNHENRGMSASRNLGIAHSKGEFVAFLDADDVWMPGKLTEQVSLLDDFPEAGMVYGRTVIWYSWTNDPNDSERDHLMDLGILADQLVQPPTLFYVLLKNKAQTPTTCNAILRRSVLTKVGGFEDSFRGAYEDQVLFAKVHLRFPVYVSGRCWAKYRQHSESCTSLSFNSKNYCLTRLAFLEWLSAYWIHTGIHYDSQAWKTLQRDMWLCRHYGYFRILNRFWQCKRQVAAFVRNARRKERRTLQLM
jgi:glycosyltransferase involved in cell wall biosynthesis